MQWRFARRAFAPMLALAAASAAASARAEPPAVASPDTPAAPETLVVPALTPIEIELGADLGSKLSKSGDRFALTLRNAIAVDGRELVPAGTPGEGEVVHAKKAGWGGAPGELVLAARFLTVDGRQLRLRSLKFGQTGDDKVKDVNTFNAVSAATFAPLSLLAFGMDGGDVIYPRGTAGAAKTAEAFAIASSTAAGPAAPETAPSADPAPGTTLQSGGEIADAEISPTS